MEEKMENEMETAMYRVMFLMRFRVEGDHFSDLVVLLWAA